MRLKIVLIILGAALLPGPAAVGETLPAALTRPDRHFLVFDTAGRGRAIEVVGDLTTARNVIVFVPGSGYRLSNFDGSSASPGGAARAIHAEADGADVAVIGWLDYDAPDMISPDILGAWAARRGAVRLRELVSGLPDGTRRSLVCHSYGSVVCGQAAPGLAVDDIVVLGSPGMGVTGIGEMETPANVWATLGSRDDVLRLGIRIGPIGLGGDPVIPSFGARVFDSGDVDHVGYLRPGSGSLEQITHIALTGSADQTT